MTQVTRIEEEAKKIRSLLNLLCDAGDEENDEDMEEYAGDIQASIDDLSAEIGIDVTEEFLNVAERLIKRRVGSYYKQALG